MGVGMIVALLVDATVVRVLLGPATKRLLGRAPGLTSRSMPGRWLAGRRREPAAC
jgi:RND superfamily putative drug exporter